MISSDSFDIAGIFYLRSLTNVGMLENFKGALMLRSTTFFVRSLIAFSIEILSSTYSDLLMTS